VVRLPKLDGMVPLKEVLRILKANRNMSALGKRGRKEQTHRYVKAPVLLQLQPLKVQ